MSEQLPLNYTHLHINFSCSMRINNITQDSYGTWIIRKISNGENDDGKKIMNETIKIMIIKINKINRSIREYWTVIGIPLTIEISPPQGKVTKCIFGHFTYHARRNLNIIVDKDTYINTCLIKIKKIEKNLFGTYNMNILYEDETKFVKNVTRTFRIMQDVPQIFAGIIPINMSTILKKN